jgi:catechol 2,3-dioxygenase-like lactoylglutathione lyase family enzyme
MFEPKAAFSGFSVDDVAKAEEFYGKTLGLDASKNEMDGLTINLPGGGHVFVYPKEAHKPAEYTMLNLVVSDVEAAVDELIKRGVTFEHYEGMQQDEKGIAWGKKHQMGPNIAWFKDPAGNILAVLED